MITGREEEKKKHRLYQVLLRCIRVVDTIEGKSFGGLALASLHIGDNNSFFLRGTAHYMWIATTYFTARRRPREIPNIRLHETYMNCKSLRQQMQPVAGTRGEISQTHRYARRNKYVRNKHQAQMAPEKNPTKYGTYLQRRITLTLSVTVGVSADDLLVFGVSVILYSKKQTRYNMSILCS